jgi:hypothetical protein
MWGNFVKLSFQLSILKRADVVRPDFGSVSRPVLTERHDVASPSPRCLSKQRRRRHRAGVFALNHCDTVIVLCAFNALAWFEGGTNIAGEGSACPAGGWSW